MNRSILAVAVASLLPYASYTQAQEVSADETMVVTANRFETSLDQTISPVIVISKQEIEASQAVTLDELLKTQPGVQVLGGGGYGKSTEVYVRGTSSRHQLVMINGVRVGSATLGSADISQILLTGVERVEYLRGPRAATYGSDAIGGVINVITTTLNEGTDVQVGAGIGSNNFYQANLSASAQIGSKGWVNFAASTQANDGFSSLPEPYEQDNDGFESNDVIVDIGVAASDALKLSAFGYYHNSESEYDNGGKLAPTYTEWGNDPNRSADTKNHVVSAKADYERALFKSELSISQGQDESLNRDDSGYRSEFKTDRTTVSWLNGYQVTESLFVSGGYDWLKENVNTSGEAYTVDSRTNNAFYLSSIWNYQDFALEGSVRTDDSDVYGRENTWQLGLAYQFIPELAWSISAGTAFKAPTFNDLYYPEDDWGSVGNPDVLPENSKHIESSLYGAIKGVIWRATAYRTEIDNLIDWVYDSATFSSSPENVNVAKITGAEFELGFNTGPLFHSVSYDYTDAIDDETHLQLQRRSQHNAKWGISYESDQWQYGMVALYRGSSFNDSDNTVRLHPYTVVDFTIGYFVTDDLVVRGRVNNALDKEYQNRLDFNGYAYNTPEREFYLNVSYKL